MPADSFEVALFETVHHHARFMAATAQTAGLDLAVSRDPAGCRGAAA
jgi:hypothetical protein